MNMLENLGNVMGDGGKTKPLPMDASSSSPQKTQLHLGRVLQIHNTENWEEGDRGTLHSTEEGSVRRICRPEATHCDDY